MPAISIAIVLLVGFILMGSANSLQSSWTTLQQVNFSLFALDVALFGLTFVAASLTYGFLAQKPLVYHQTLLVAVSSAFSGKLLPAGTGGVATYYLYLRRKGHSVGQAGSVAAANNSIGALAHAALIVIIILIRPQSFAGFTTPRVSGPLLGIVVAAAVLLGVLGIVFSSRLAGMASSAWGDLQRVLATYRSHPLRIAGAFGSSLCVTLVYASCLQLALLAVGGSLSIFATLAIFTLGAAASGVAPTPGGVGAVEAGLVAGFVGYGISAPLALAAAVIYRLVSFWIPFAVGSLAIIFARQKKLL
ncbi:MAG: integral rane protein-like protein [Candidatus Saccharibacteria bacterium]|nr:integral rane protein-like protein [Candidatus Saccharibacteria bacterium]